MPKFRITINPAKRTDSNSTEIGVTTVLKRAVVECKLDGLRAAMTEAAKGVVSSVPDLPQLHVYASPEGRSPNGFKAFEAANQNQMLIDPISTPAPETEAADVAA